MTNEKAVSEHFIVSHYPQAQSFSLIGDAVMDLLEGGLRGITSMLALQSATRHTFPLQKVLRISVSDTACPFKLQLRTSLSDGVW